MMLWMVQRGQFPKGAPSKGSFKLLRKSESDEPIETVFMSDAAELQS